MWNELEQAIDCLFKEYFEKKDYSTEAKERLVDDAVEMIRKLLHPKKGELYFEEAPLGFIYIDNEEIKEWITEFIETSEKEEAEKPFHDYLKEMIDQAKEREWVLSSLRDKEKIKKAANFYALEFLKEKESVREEERKNLWTENANMAWAFVSQLVEEEGGTYKLLGFEFNPSLYGSQQSTDKHGVNKGEFNKGIFQRFLEGYKNDDGTFCGSYLYNCVDRYLKESVRKGTRTEEKNGTKKRKKIIEMESIDKPISNDDKEGPSFGDSIIYEEKEGDVETVIWKFVNLTKVLSDFTRIHVNMTGRTQNNKTIKWHRFLVFYTRKYVAEICDLFDSSWVKKINRDIDIIFRSHYRKMEFENKETRETEIIDYTDCSVCQTFIYCLENEETRTEAQSVAKIRELRPAYVDAVALLNKRHDNKLIAERSEKGYLNQYFGHSNLSETIQEYETMINELRKKGKLDVTDESRDAYLRWLNTHGERYRIYEEEELIRRYAEQRLMLRFRLTHTNKCIGFIEEVREGGDRLTLVEFQANLTDINTIKSGINEAYRIASMIFDKIYGEKKHVLSAHKECDYVKMMSERIENRLREKKNK